MPFCKINGTKKLQEIKLLSPQSEYLIYIKEAVFFQWNNKLVRQFE